MTGRKALVAEIFAVCALCLIGCSSSTHSNSRSSSAAALSRSSSSSSSPKAAKLLQASATPPTVAVAPGGRLTVTAPSASVVLHDTPVTAGPNLTDRQRLALEHSRIQRERMQKFMRDRVKGLRTLESVREHQAEAQQRTAEAISARQQQHAPSLTPVENAVETAAETANAVVRAATSAR